MIGSPVPDALDALVQTRAVVQKALQLYPPIIGITRTALRRTELAGRIIDRGTMVVISPYVVHRHRLHWNDPEIFDPSRFLPGRSKTIERYTFLPFGVGAAHVHRRRAGGAGSHRGSGDTDAALRA